jgi:hypothetical protein
MSEGQVSRLLRQLGLFARRDVVVAQDGRILSGSIDPEVEALYQDVDHIHDWILDGHQPNPLQLEFLEHCLKVVQQQRPIIRQLEREFA